MSMWKTCRCEKHVDVENMSMWKKIRLETLNSKLNKSKAKNGLVSGNFQKSSKNNSFFCPRSTNFHNFKKNWAIFSG